MKFSTIPVLMFVVLASWVAAPIATADGPGPGHEHHGHHHEGAEGESDQHDHHHADEGDHEHPTVTGPVQETPIKPVIPDHVLIDQFGNKHRFYSDLVAGKLVLLNSVYTTCQGTCPVQTAIFKRVQTLLGDRVGNDVQMLSVSLDPVTDTPERLLAFSERYKTGPGWLFLTGDKQDVTEVLEAMDLYAAVPEEHTPIASVGNEPAGLWMKVINLAAPQEIVKRLDYLKHLGDQRTAETVVRSSITVPETGD